MFVANLRYLILFTFVLIFLVPKMLMVSTVGLRPEDLAGFVVLLLLPILLLKTNCLLPAKLILYVGLYFIYILVVSLIRDYEHIFGIMVLLSKELSYFGFFLISYFVVIKSTPDETKRFFQNIFIVSMPVVFYLLFQLISNKAYGMYGIAVYGHEQSPASSGTIVLMMFVLGYVYAEVFGVSKSLILYLFVVALLVFFVASKLAVVGLFSFVVVNISLNKRISSIGKAVILLCVVVLLLIVPEIDLESSALHRISSIYSNPIQEIILRGIWWKVDWIDGFLGVLTGMGLAAGHVNPVTGGFSFGMAMDNLFLYNLVVLGAFGSILFCLVLMYLVSAYPMQSNEKKIQVSLVISYFAMGMGGEVFQLSITGTMFWLISGILLGVSKCRTSILPVVKSS